MRHPEDRACSGSVRDLAWIATALLPMPQPQALPTPVGSPATVDRKSVAIHKAALSRISEERNCVGYVIRRSKASHGHAPGDVGVRV